jgi:hypothetical protein
VANDDLSASLADAVADGLSIDSTSRRPVLDATDADLVRSFRIIASIGEARRAVLASEHERGSRALLLLSTSVAAIAFGKLSLAMISAIAGWSRVPPGQLHWAFGLNLVIFGTSGLVLVLGGTRDRRVQALGVLFLIIASAFADPLLPARATNTWTAIASWARNVYADAFLSFALWLFVWLFPTEPRQPRARRVGRTLLVISGCLGIALCAANASLALPLWGTPSTSGIEGAMRLLDRTASTLLYWPMLFAVAAPAIPFLLWKFRAATVENRNRITWFVASLVFGFSPILFAVIVTPLIPQLKSEVWQARIGLVLYATLASIVPSTAYAVAVTHVLDLHLVIRRTIQYGLARSSVWCAILGPLVFVAYDINENRQLTVEQYLSGGRPVVPLALSCVSFLILTFRHQVLKSLDRWFKRDAADHTESLARLERGLRAARTIRDISNVLKRELGHAVHPASVAVLLVDEQRGQLASLDSTVPPLGRGSALLDLLRSVRTEVQLSYRADGAVASLLPASDRTWLAETGFGLFYPLVGSTGTLLGVVGIGEGKNGLPYTERDNMLIAAMSGQTALKLENSRLKEQSIGPAAAGDQAAVDWDNEPATRCPECALMWTPTTTRCSCGSTTVEAALPLVVRGKFRVDRFIGSGGTGVVYHAVDMALDRQVAIKTLPAIRLEHASRLHREARAMANVLHPNLALIYGAEQWKGTPILIFEYLEGGTLSDSLLRGPLMLEEVLDLGTLLADALDRVHASGVLHRDIKPSNIGYTSDGVPKLLDFGLAAILDRSRDRSTPPAVLPTDPGLIAELTWGVHPTTSLTLTQQLVGTPLYLSPEALSGREPEASFDLWSLNLVLYEAFAGRHPFANETILEVVTRIQRGTIPDIRSFRPDCPSTFAAFLSDALSPAAERRPATASELRMRLRWLRDKLFPSVI